MTAIATRFDDYYLNEIATRLRESIAPESVALAVDLEWLIQEVYDLRDAIDSIEDDSDSTAFYIERARNPVGRDRR